MARLSLRLLDERINTERRLREQSHRTTARALRLQATEYERRLESLNHAHQQTIETAARTVPREMFEQYVRENTSRVELALAAINARHEATDSAQTERTNSALGVHRTDIEALNNRVDEMMTWRSGIEGRLIGISVAVGITVIVINIALKFV